VAYISLVALFLTVTNFVPVSAIGFAPLLLCIWRFYGRSYPEFIAPLVAFSAYVVLSTLLYDPASFLTFDFYRRDGNFFISYAPMLAGCLYAHRWDLNKLLRFFFIFAVLVNVPSYALFVGEVGPLAMLQHSGGSFGSYFVALNAAGGFLAMLFCLGVACYMHQRSKLILVLLAFNALMLFSTYSRGSLLGIVAVLPYLLFGRKPWVLLGMMAGIIACSIGIALYNLSPTVDYMGYPFNMHNADAKVANLDIRYEWLWPRAFTYFRQSPLFGVGFGSFDDDIASLISYFGLVAQPVGVIIKHSDSHAHNSYLSFLAELGLVGLSLFMIFIWQLIRWAANGAADALKEGRHNYVAYLSIELSSVCLLVMSFSEHRLTSPSNVLILSLTVSLLLASRVPDMSAVRASAPVPRPRATPGRNLRKT
jgi:O-antigen ligase